jgi:hypothetical protein
MLVQRHRRPKTGLRLLGSGIHVGTNKSENEWVFEGSGKQGFFSDPKKAWERIPSHMIANQSKWI